MHTRTKVRNALDEGEPPRLERARFFRTRLVSSLEAHDVFSPGVHHSGAPRAASASEASRKGANDRQTSIWKAPSARRQSTISTLSNRVRGAKPTGKALRSRSSGQPALRTRAAAKPLAMRPIWRCETSTRLWAVPSSTDSSISPSGAESTPSASRSHSSGPSQRAARRTPSLAGPSLDGGSAPKAMPQATRAPSPPRRMKRAAGGASIKANRGPAGRARPCSGERTLSAASDMKARSRLVVEDRRRNRHRNRAARHRDIELGADARAPRRDERERDRAAEGRARVGRGD